MHSFCVGDTVYYCGERYWGAYKDIPLKLGMQRQGRWICQKPDGYLTTDIPVVDLSRTSVDKPRRTRNRQLVEADWMKDDSEDYFE